MLGHRGQGKEGALGLPHSLELQVPALGSSWSSWLPLDGCGCGQVLSLLFWGAGQHVALCFRSDSPWKSSPEFGGCW